jgi:very-short-patch-repair endonuclease
MISNTIEIVSNADKVLVYDQPIGSDGLRWGNLQAWWAKKQNMANDDEAKKSLYNRLKSSLPTESESPPQQRFFTAYHKAYGPRIPRLPALLPEVWLHWDPQTVAQRGRHALVRFRMDFLMLLPNGGRVVFEIDGKHHYTNDDGKSNPTKYARMIAADRELKLTGYEVFRFGATELKSDDADQLVKDFFADLFRVYKVELSR